MIGSDTLFKHSSHRQAKEHFYTSFKALINRALKDVVEQEQIYNVTVRLVLETKANKHRVELESAELLLPERQRELTTLLNQKFYFWLQLIKVSTKSSYIDKFVFADSNFVNRYTETTPGKLAKAEKLAVVIPLLYELHEAVQYRHGYTKVGSDLAILIKETKGIYANFLNMGVPKTQLSQAVLDELIRRNNALTERLITGVDESILNNEESRKKLEAETKEFQGRFTQVYKTLANNAETIYNHTISANFCQEEAKLLNIYAHASDRRSLRTVSKRETVNQDYQVNLTRAGFKFVRDSGLVLSTDVCTLTAVDGYVYLTALVDVSDNTVPGINISVKPESSEAYLKALKDSYLDKPCLVYQSDNGSFPTQQVFKHCIEHGQLLSVNRKGSPLHNQPVESIFGAFQCENGLIRNHEYGISELYTKLYVYRMELTEKRYSNFEKHQVYEDRGLALKELTRLNKRIDSLVRVATENFPAFIHLGMLWFSATFVSPTQMRRLFIFAALQALLHGEVCKGSQERRNVALKLVRQALEQSKRINAEDEYLMAKSILSSIETVFAQIDSVELFTDYQLLDDAKQQIKQALTEEEYQLLDDLEFPDQVRGAIGFSRDFKAHLALKVKDCIVQLHSHAGIALKSEDVTLEFLFHYFMRNDLFKSRPEVCAEFVGLDEVPAGYSTRLMTKDEIVAEIKLRNTPPGYDGRESKERLKHHHGRKQPRPRL